MYRRPVGRWIVVCCEKEGEGNPWPRIQKRKERKKGRQNGDENALAHEKAVPRNGMRSKLTLNEQDRVLVYKSPVTLEIYRPGLQQART